jgi:hypothetical protein
MFPPLSYPSRKFFAPLFLILLCATVSIHAQKSPAPETAPVDKYTWRVTVGNRAPDCFERPVLLINDEFGPILDVHQGDLLEVRD